MIDLDNIRENIATALHEYLGVQVIRSNTTAPFPQYPFASYTIRELLRNQRGTWGEYDDGKDRISASQIWSITIQAKDSAESMALALKAYDFFCHSGCPILKDKNIVVSSVSEITNRDNMLTVGYEYKNGFDVTFSFMNETDNTLEITGYISEANILSKEA